MGSFPETHNYRKSLTVFETGKKLLRSKNCLEPFLRGLSPFLYKKCMKPSHIESCLCEAIIQITIFCNALESEILAR